MSAQWYYGRNNQQYGPVSEQEIKRLFQTGELKLNDLVWTPGMASWVPASAVPSLFPQSSVSTSQPASQPGSRTAETAAATPRRRRPIEDDDDDDDDDNRIERRPRRSRAKKGGGLVWLLVGGAACLLLLCAGIGIAIWLISSAGGSSLEGSRSWSLNTNQKATYNLYFQQGHRVELIVQSTGASDIDLFVFDGNQKIAFDESTDKDCLIRFDPAASKYYRVEVWNRDLIPERWRNGHNSGTLRYKHYDLKDAPPLMVQRGAIPPIKMPPINPPPFNPPGGNQPAPQPPAAAGGKFVLNVSGRINVGQEVKHQVTLQANKIYTIDLQSRDIDSFLTLRDDKGKILQVNDDRAPGQLDSRIIYAPATAGTYELLCRDLSRSRAGNYRLTVYESGAKGPVFPPPVEKKGPVFPPPIGKKETPKKSPANNMPPPAPPRPDITKTTLNTVNLLTPGQLGMQNVLLQANLTYHIEVLSNAFDPVVEVQDNTGKTIASDKGSGDDRRNAYLQFRPPQNGVYRLVVRSADNGSGLFRLVVRH